MLNAGEMVKLLIEKRSAPGDLSMVVRSGIIGMIVRVDAVRPGRSETSYVVDFGPEGQWNCTEEEIESLTPIRSEPDYDSDEPDDWLEDDNIDDYDENEEDEDDIEEEHPRDFTIDEGLDGPIGPAGDLPGGGAMNYDVKMNSQIVPTISFEKDLEKMMKKMSKK